MKHLSKEQGLYFLRKAGVIVEYQEIGKRYEDCLAQFTEDWFDFNKGDVLTFVREEEETGLYVLTTGQFCGGMIYYAPREVIRFVERVPY